MRGPAPVRRAGSAFFSGKRLVFRAQTERKASMGKYFGTDGFRGEANVNLTSEHAYQIGKFIGW